MYKQWTDDEIDFLKSHYKEMTYKELSQQLHKTKNAVDLKINRLGLKKEKYTYNRDYFETIDSGDKAYWLGFIHADGSVSINEKLNSCELSIKLQGKDIEHLKKFNKCIDGNNKIDIFNRQCNFNDKYFDGCQIRLYSEKMVHDLAKYGIVPNKSLIIGFPDIPNQFIPDFIRGVFDGDGCICKSSAKLKDKAYVKCDFTSGSMLFLTELRQVLFGYGIKSYIYNNHDDIYKLVIGGMQNCDNFLHLIYDDANIYLDRKYSKKKRLYEELHIEQRLLRQTEKSGSFNLSEKENGNPEMEIRVEGYA